MYLFFPKFASEILHQPSLSKKLNWHPVNYKVELAKTTCSKENYFISFANIGK